MWFYREIHARIGARTFSPTLYASLPSMLSSSETELSSRRWTCHGVERPR